MPSAQLLALIDAVGREPFEQAADRAWATAPLTGLAESPGSGGESLLHELCWQIGELAPPGRKTHRKSRLLTDLYGLAPDYAILMALRWEHRAWSPATRRLVWRRYRRWLADDEALAAPAQYSLWCDWFEDPTTASAAWRAVVRRPQRRLRLERVLDCAGPVPYPLKARLYDALSGQRRWHQAIFVSLVHSAQDLYGSLEPGHARELLTRLEVPADTPGRDFFSKRFGWPGPRR